MSANVQEKSNRKIEQKEIIQTLVFTRWCNKYLGLVNKQIVQLDTDFSDGLKLIDLLRVLSHTKLKRQWRYPVLKRQKIGNVALAHKFMVKQNIISAVDIEVKAIVGGDLKQILELIWRLLCFYSPFSGQLKSYMKPEKDPQQQLLEWIQAKAPELNVKDFTFFWQNGVALGALIDAVKKGLCPNWKKWDPQNKLKNVTRAMNIGEEMLGVSQLITPNELINPAVDERSVVAYLFQFPQAHLDLGSGRNATIGRTQRTQTLQSVKTVLRNSSSHQFESIIGVNFTEMIMEEIRQTAGIVIGQSFSQNRFSFLVPNDNRGKEYLKNAEPRTGKSSTTEVATEGVIQFEETDLSLLDATIRSPLGVTQKCSLKKLQDGDIGISFIQQELGEHFLSVSKNGIQLTNSPLSIVIRPATGISNNEINITTRPTRRENNLEKFSLASKNDVSFLQSVKVKKFQVVENNDSTFTVFYNPDEAEVNNNKKRQSEPAFSKFFSSVNFKSEISSPCSSTVQAQIQKPEISDMPTITLKTDGRQLTPANDFSPVKILFDANKTDLSLLSVVITSPSGKQEEGLLRKKTNKDAEISFVPNESGEHMINVLKNGVHVQNSPFRILVADRVDNADGVKVYGEGRHLAISGKTAEFFVNIQNAGSGKLEISIEGPSKVTVKCNCDSVEKKTYKISYITQTPGTYSIDIKFSGIDVPGSPFALISIPEQQTTNNDLQNY